MRMKTLLVTATVLLLSHPHARATSEMADREIQYLLDYVAASGCSFERNGSVHDPADAADHLRLKYRRGGRYADSAENFIDRLASESSWTGRAYNVDCDGQVIPTGEWLHEALDDFRETADDTSPGQ